MGIRPTLMIVIALGSGWGCVASAGPGSVTACLGDTVSPCACTSGAAGTQTCAPGGTLNECVCADAGGDTINDTVTDTPDEGGPEAGQDNDTGISTCLAISPQPVVFGSQLVGQSVSRTVDLMNCGVAPVTISELRLQNDSETETTLSANFRLDLGGLANVPAGTTGFTNADEPLVLDRNDRATFLVTFTPSAESPLGADGQPLLVDVGSIKIVSDASKPEREVPVSGFGVLKACPTAIIEVQEGAEVIPQTVLHLSGAQSIAVGGVSKYQWRVIAPSGAAQTFFPSDGASDPTFEANVAGTYLFRLKVWDLKNRQSCHEAEFQVHVVPDEAIHVELLWATPGDSDESDTGPDAGSDLDIHFANPSVGGVDGTVEPWFHMEKDCFWFNSAPNWGSSDPLVDDDPSLDRDDTDGAGPENVNLNIPENGSDFRVGVHYFYENGFGPSFATIRVYIHSVLALEIAGVELVQNDLWDAVSIQWPSGEVTPITGPDGGYKVIPEYPKPVEFQ